MDEALVIVTATWTTAAIIAVILHAFSYRQAAKNQHAVRKTFNPLGKEFANMIARMELVRLTKGALLAALGIGVLAGFKGIGWLLIPIPVIGIIATTLDLRSRARQTIYAEQLLDQSSTAATQQQIIHGQEEAASLAEDLLPLLAEISKTGRATHIIINNDRTLLLTALATVSRALARDHPGNKKLQEAADLAEAKALEAQQINENPESKL